MSKNKKIKKAGSTTRNIHKIATTIGMVPLVTMSSFLFHNSYALADGVHIQSLRNVTIDLSSDNCVSIDAEYLFGPNSGYTLTPLVSLSSTSALSADFNFATNNTITLEGSLPGTYTVTVDVVKEGITDYTDFKVVVIEPAVTVNALDTDHNGFDIGDIVTARSSSPQNPAADINADGVVNGTDIEKLLTFIPFQYANHSPRLVDTSPSLPPITLTSLNTTLNIDNNFFSDPDGDTLSYKIFKDGNSAAVPYFYGSLTGSLASPQLAFRASEIGSMTYTVVAYDNHGGYKAATMVVNVNEAP
jgi:hypothetical protein